MSDNSEILGQIQKAVTELRETNDANLKSRDTVLETKLATINSAITEMQKQIQRPTVTNEIDPAVSEHKSAWSKWARKGAGEDQLEELEQKAITMNNGTGTANADGGYLMPKTVAAGIYTALETLSPIRSEATVIQVSSDDYRFMTGNGVFESGWVGETAARPETATNTFGETRVPMGELYAYPHVSQRALDDVAFDLDAYVVDQTARAFAIRENDAFINGDGANKPKGILTTAGIASVNTGTAYSAGTNAGYPVNADAYIKMTYKLGAAYRAGAKFLMGSAAQEAARLVKNANGDYIWQNSVIEGQADKLNGYSIITAEETPGLGANANVGIFGNFKLGYLIVDRLGIRTLRDPYSKKPFVGLYSTARVGGMVKDAAAFVTLKVAA